MDRPDQQRQPRAVAASVGGQTPEELETLLEDALLLRDGKAVTELFDGGGVLVIGERIWHMREHAERLVSHDSSYLAEPRQIIQSQDIALLLGDGVINVAHRGSDASWRYRIAVIQPNGNRTTPAQSTPPGRNS